MIITFPKKTNKYMVTKGEIIYTAMEHCPCIVIEVKNWGWAKFYKVIPMQNTFLQKKGKVDYLPDYAFRTASQVWNAEPILTYNTKKLEDY